MKSNSRRRSQQSGTLILAYAAMLMGILGFSGLAVDAGYLQYEKRRLQAAADAAAMGALRELERGQTDLTAAGQNDASLNGFTDGKNNTTVTVNHPPAGGTYASNSAAVQAVVTRQIPTLFMMIFGQTSVTVSAQAVGLTTNQPGSIGGCIFAMNKTANPSMWVSGTASLSTACSIAVNSDASAAYTEQGGAGVYLANGAKVGVVGPGTAGSGWNIGSNAQLTNSTTNKSESPVNIQSFLDPLANVTAPTPATVTTGVQSTSQTKIDQNHMPPNNQLNPGVYCKGISIQSTSGTLTFNSGTYVLAGGGMNINSGAIVSATGVTFYNTSENSMSWGCPGSSAIDSITLNGGATINLAAPTSGNLCGILFFEDRNLSTNGDTINGNSSSTFNGTLYFLNDQLTFAGTNSTGHGYLSIVADTIKIVGNSNLNNDYSDLENIYTIAPASTGGGLVQ